MPLRIGVSNFHSETLAAPSSFFSLIFVGNNSVTNMKIFCIGRNYADHAKEMNSPLPSEPMVFMKPPTALLINNDPFYIPEWSEEVHYEGEIVLRVCKNGKYVQPEFAHTYYDKIAFGIDFTARDVQSRLKANGHPWEIGKGFDNSAAVSQFLDLDSRSTAPVTIETRLNDETVQSSDSSHMIFEFDRLICHLSMYFTIQQGDYIFTGTPAGVGKVSIGDKIDGYLNGQHLLTCDIK